MEALLRARLASAEALPAAECSDPQFADLFAPTAWLHASFMEPSAPRKRARTASAEGHDDDSMTASEATKAGGSNAAAAHAVDDRAVDASSQSALAPARETEAALPADTLAALATLRKPLCDASLSEEARAAKCARGMHALLSLVEPAAMRVACTELAVESLPDEALLCACQAAAQPQVSGRAAAAFMGAALRSRLVGLEQPASRTLFNALVALLHAHARPLVEELLVPIMRLAGGALRPPQVEALSRLLKELPEALLGKAMADFLAGEGGVPVVWAEPHVALLQALVARKPSLDPAALGELLVQADANADALRKSLKFSSLLATLVKTHGAQLRPSLPSLRRVVERLETFMRKSILAAVGKLEQQAGATSG